MTQRKYSAQEIELMRIYVRNITPNAINMSTYEFEMAALERLKIHIYNGTDPNELKEMSDIQVKQEMKFLERLQAETHSGKT